jgi:hypothetical protein
MQTWTSPILFRPGTFWIPLALVAWIPLFSGCQKKETAAPPSTPATASPAAAQTASVTESGLRIRAKVAEIPGSFPANDLYNYVYVMRYEVLEVLAGQYTEKDILVGQYNPRMSRSDIKDDLDSLVDGNATTFEEGASQELMLAPMDTLYHGAVEDEFFQDKRPRWFATKTDKI